METQRSYRRFASFVRGVLWIHFVFYGGPVLAQTGWKEQTECRLLNEARENIEKYRKGDAVLTLLTPDGRDLQNAEVRIDQLTQDFLFGNLSEEIFHPGLSAQEVQKFESYFTSLFNFTELTVKWLPYESEQGKPQWADLEKKLEWCRKNKITPKGHTLGWTHMAGTPEWLLKLPLETTYALYKARIYNLTGGFKDQISMWDVVNEPVTTVPWEVAMKDTVLGESLIAAGDRYNTENISLEEVIPWVEKSLRWAYEANPESDLMLNEFYLIAKPDVREKFYRLIKELQKRGVVLTGIGIQAHEPREMWFSPLEIIETYNLYQKLGIPLHITEFIPQSSGKAITGGWREGVWTEETQAEFAEQFYTLSFGHPAIASIHWWGLTDKMIWLEGGGLLDKKLDPKPVYKRLSKLIKEDWMTKNLRMKTSKNGEVAFRGFFGRYRAVVCEPGGKRHEFEFHLQKEGTNEWTFRLN